MKKALSLILIQALLLNIASAYFLVSPVYGSKASEAGDQAWGECKRRGGSDQECRRAAENAYNREAGKNPPSQEEKKKDEAADKARVEALKKRAEELQKQGVSKEEAEARASERMIGGCSSSHPYNGQSCTKHPPGGQCPGDYQWCDGGCCRYSGGAPKPAEEPRKKACNDRDIGEVWGECHPGGVWKKVKCVGPQQWEVLDTACKPECGCKPEEKKPEFVPIPVPKKKACNDRDIGEDWGECHGTTWKHVECISEQKWEVRETKENSPTCGGQPQEENVSPLPAAVEAQTAAGDLGNCSQNCRDSSNRCTQPVGSVSPGPEGKTYVCVANWRNQKVAGWEVAEPGEEKPAPSTFIAAPQTPIYNSAEEEKRAQRQAAWQKVKWTAPEPTPTSQVGRGLWGVIPVPTKAPTPIPKPTPTGPHAMTPEELAQTIERFQNPQPGDVIETPTGTRVVVTQSQSGGTFRGRVVDKGHEANFNISDIKVQTPKELVVDTDGDKIPDKVEKMAMDMGYKNLNPEKDESKVAPWLPDYNQAKEAVKRAGLEGINPNTWTKEQEKTVERQLDYQKDPLKITQIVALPLGPVGAVGFAYPQWKERQWNEEDANEVLESFDPHPNAISYAYGPTEQDLYHYPKDKLPVLAEKANVNLGSITQNDINAYFDETIGCVFSGACFIPPTDEEARRKLGWDENKLKQVKEIIGDLTDYRKELAKNPDIAPQLAKLKAADQNFGQMQALSIGFDIAAGPIISEVASAIGGKVAKIVGLPTGPLIQEPGERAVIAGFDAAQIDKIVAEVAPGGQLGAKGAKTVTEGILNPDEALVAPKGVIPDDPKVAAAARGAREIAEATTAVPETSRFLKLVDDSPLPSQAKNALKNLYYSLAGERGAITVSSPARQNLVRTLEKTLATAEQISAAQSIFDDYSSLAAKRVAELQAQGIPEEEIIRQVSLEMQEKTANLVSQIPGRDPKAVWYHLTDALEEEIEGLVKGTIKPPVRAPVQVPAAAMKHPAMQQFLKTQEENYASMAKTVIHTVTNTDDPQLVAEILSADPTAKEAIQKDLAFALQRELTSFEKYFAEAARQAGVPEQAIPALTQQYKEIYRKKAQEIFNNVYQQMKGGGILDNLLRRLRSRNLKSFSVLAAEPESLVLSPTAYEILARKVLTAKAFEGKDIEKMSDEVIIKILEQVAEADLEPKPVAEKIDNKYLLTTDLNGSVSHKIEPGVYTLKVDPIGDLTINAPETINVSIDGGTIEIGLWTKQEELPIYIRIPGKIFEKFFSLIDKVSNLIPKVEAQVQSKSQKLTLQLFHDENNNGLKDPTEVRVNWAGVKVVLAKETQEKTYHLLEGWNLVSLPVIPTSISKATELIVDVAKQGGYVTTVARWQNGKWEEFIQRGANQFGFDFEIEPGVAYFLRNHKEINWIVAGKEISTPLPLDLQEGWNGIGIPYSAESLTASRVLDSVGLGNADTISRWESGLWDALVKRIYSPENIQEYGNNFSIESTRGYMIRLNKEVKWTPYKEVETEPPAATGRLFKIAELVTAYWWVGIFVLAGGLYFLKRYFMRL